MHVRVLSTRFLIELPAVASPICFPTHPSDEGKSSIKLNNQIVNYLVYAHACSMQIQVFDTNFVTSPFPAELTF